MKNIRNLLAVVMIIATGMISCSKTGDTGPAGPAGPPGPDSVIYSPWIDLTATATGSGFQQTLSAPSITQDILDKGMILTYVKLLDSLGNSHVISVASIELLGLFDDYTLGQINIFASDDFSGIPYRYVTIPGSKVTGNGASRKVNGYTISEMNSMPYDKLQQVLSDKN